VTRELLPQVMVRSEKSFASSGLTGFGKAVARLRESRVAMIGVGIVITWALLALFAPWISSYGPNAQDALALADPTPSSRHLLGTDFLGRDILSRLLYGARVSLTVAPIAVLVAYAVGCTLGLLAGYYGGWVDTLISRFSDVVLSFPVLILYVILIAAVGPSALNIIVAVTIASSPGVGRIVRGLTLSVRKLDYVAAAQTRGESALYIMVVEILPTARGPLIVDFCLRIGYTVIIIGNLGFIGLGLPPPDPDWGSMVKDTIAVMTVWPHMSVLPCIAIVSLAVGFNLLADGLREIMARE
jgi:peptide/nickel transport system permease protein